MVAILDRISRDSVPGAPLLEVIQQAGPVPMKMPFKRINVLEQVRKTYEGIAELVDEFATAGWLSDPNVAVLTPAQATRYLDYINRVYGSAHQLAELVVLSHRPRRFAIVIAGHCRLLANELMWEVGCSVCREEFGPEPPGTCYQRHAFEHNGSFNGVIDVKAFPGISARQALSKQFSENKYNRPPAHEVADGLDRWFAAEKWENPDLTPAAFARTVKVGSETMRRAIRYCRLPEGIRRDVESGRLPFGTALALGRLAEHFKLKGDALEAYKEQIVLEKLTVARVERMVEELIGKDQNEIYVTLENDGATIGFENITAGQKAKRRQVFEQLVVQYAHALAKYFQRATPLIQSGEMGDLSDATYLSTSTVAIFLEAIDWLELVLPLIEHKLGELQALRSARVLARGRQAFGQLIAEAREIETEDAPGLFAVVGD